MRQVVVDDTTVALRLLVDRRDQLGRTRAEVVSRLHHLLLELVPGGAQRFLSAQQARAMLNTARPRDVVDKTRRWLASELIHELVTIDKKIKIANVELTDLVDSTGSRLQQVRGIGPSGAARLLGDIGGFASRTHFASWNGTAPIDASSGDQNRHRLSRAGNGRINRVLHIMAIVQPWHDNEGHRYYRRKLAAGKTTMEALRALNAGCPTSSTNRWSLTQNCSRRAREDTADVDALETYAGDWQDLNCGDSFALSSITNRYRRGEDAVSVQRIKRFGLTGSGDVATCWTSARTADQYQQKAHVVDLGCWVDAGPLDGTRPLGVRRRVVPAAAHAAARGEPVPEPTMLGRFVGPMRCCRSAVDAR